MRRSLHRRELLGRNDTFLAVADVVSFESFRKRLNGDWSVTSSVPQGTDLLSRSVRPTISTIAVCISNDGYYLASTHGDHSVRVFDLTHSSCAMIRQFRGHPRTPWVVKFHPYHSDILASGCIGHEVRVWSVNGGGSSDGSYVSEEHCLASFHFPNAIISLSFSTKGDYLAISSSHEVYYRLWKGEENAPLEDDRNTTKKIITHSRTIHAVMFHPRGSTLLVVASEFRDSLEAYDLKTIFVVPFPLTLKGKTDVSKHFHIEAVPLDDFPRILTGIHCYTDSGLDCSRSGDELLVIRKPISNTGYNVIDGIHTSTEVGEKRHSSHGARLEVYSLDFEFLRRYAEGDQACDLAGGSAAASRSMEGAIYLRSSFDLPNGVASITSVSFASTANVFLVSYGKRKQSSRSHVASVAQRNMVCQLILRGKGSINETGAENNADNGTPHRDVQSSINIYQNQDEVNVAKRSPLVGGGVFYGCKDGKVCCIGRL